MKSFLVKTGIFFLVFLLICFGVDYSIQEGLKTSNYREVSKWNEVVQGGIDAELLIVGSSRALVHFDCERIEKYTGLSCYNLGFDGTNYPLQKLMLQLYLRKNESPKHIIWSLDYHSFEPMDQFYGFEQLIPYQEEVEVQSMLKLNKQTPAYLYQLPIIRYAFNPKMKRNGILNYIGIKKRKKTIIKGYRKEDKIWDGTFDSLLVDIKDQYINTIDEVLWKDFLNENIRLQKNGISIYWMLTPYYEGVNHMIRNHKEIKERYSVQANELGIPFEDYSKEDWISSKSFFYNGGHLNQNGVARFMDLVVQQLIEFTPKKNSKQDS